MNLSDITSKAWILALFKRDDGERFLLGDGWYDFKDSLQHFQPNTIANDIVELQGADGQLLAGQVRRSAAQSFNGYVGDASVNQQTIESRRRDFLMFFRKKHFYTVIYIFPDGSTIQRQRGYLTDDPSVPEMWQFFPEYHVALNFENVHYYEYAEDSAGDEIYSNVRTIAVSSVIEGGLMWDSLGAISDSLGFVWEDGGVGGITTIDINGVDSALPLWTVAGPTVNPTLTNITTGQSITWAGTVPSGQTLLVDMDKQTATMEGANVYAFISGDWVELRPGTNRLSYSVTGTANPSTLSWNNIVG